MIDPAAPQKLRDAIMSQAGGFLANPVRVNSVTCEVCAAPIESRYTHCARCQKAIWDGHQLADLVGSTTYAKRAHQTGTIMHGYNSNPPQRQHQVVVQLLLADALTTHRECAEKIVDETITRWASVPSLTKERSWHPLRDLVRPVMVSTPQTLVRAAERWSDPRAVTPSNFIVEKGVDGEHVLLIDDTWTTGGQAQSVAVSLKDAGASHVTIYTVARWLDDTWPPTKDFLAARRAMNPRPRFDPTICPFTHSACP